MVRPLVRPLESLADHRQTLGRAVREPLRRMVLEEAAGKQPTSRLATGLTLRAPIGTAHGLGDSGFRFCARRDDTSPSHEIGHVSQAERRAKRPRSNTHIGHR